MQICPVNWKRLPLACWRLIASCSSSVWDLTLAAFLIRFNWLFVRIKEFPDGSWLGTITSRIRSLVITVTVSLVPGSNQFIKNWVETSHNIIFYKLNASAWSRVPRSGVLHFSPDFFLAAFLRRRGKQWLIDVGSSWANPVGETFIGAPTRGGSGTHSRRENVHS